MGDALEHSVLAPSSAYMWRRCAGSIQANRGYPDKVGVEAAEGTMFHFFADLAVKFGLEPHDFPVGFTREIDGHVVSYTEEMIEDMYEGIEWILSNIEEGAVLFTEQKVPIEEWTLEPGGFGTSDICIILPIQRKIIIADWKYGKIAVSAAKNDQLYLYCLGLWKKYGKKFFGGDPSNIEVEFRILQPRVPLKGSSWKTTMKKVLREGESIKIDAEATYEKDAPRVAGEKQCRYCRARSDCEVWSEFNLKLMSLYFEDIDEGYEQEKPPKLPDTRGMTPERRSYILLHRSCFMKFLDDMYRSALNDHNAGRPVPKMKLVLGRSGRRKFRESVMKDVRKNLVSDLGAEAFIKTLVSPAVAEKKLGKKVFKKRYGSFVEQTPPKPSLVPDTDERPAVESVVDLFDSIEEE